MKTESDDAYLTLYVEPVGCLSAPGGRGHVPFAAVPRCLVQSGWKCVTEFPVTLLQRGRVEFKDLRDKDTRQSLKKKLDKDIFVSISHLDVS